ncbi:hypothetical protein [Pseudosulfitobacter pseudonitzschiae]|uniref:hypothetical protein n=1 Tax=Pseudosulfitobacter pseudonitzschiae TaxID=1402135 RepID=UPI001AF98342|nr:hypothetical protein [Pseudosulfitobacter pseudonitzschiae]MBM1814500.1 hypothetical protein [Pseudosulfitobacter pseudonitzschiae]MBM1831493.1 hypothetical protein [Pseudosulfitobacter pseudonitzschiae]MBM1836360.1 hypothetical protein [Pseudosulfitobacter pseudonitzschiae]MBM1841206.1 hypothetical protein [Pseudosulfitobacter pseudonitzschiae]MBM1846074.1 hypothetical protein [Pseudosulfitobacter pseudonitzschiae]
MTETALALILAWLLAFHLLPARAPLALRIAVVFALGWGALGGAAHMAAAAALGHTAVALAAKRLPVHLWSYLGTQAAHVMVIVAVLLWMPGAFANGLWGAYAHTIAPIAVMLGGVISATLMGGPAVGLLMAPWRATAQIEGLDNAGRIIGLMERALIYLMVMIGEPTGIGFLIAAKSILRFETASRDQKASEYVIIGTLASFGWALAWGFAAQSMIAMLR